ncbi:MAG: hypothetical protein JNM94_04340 [Phycisphaerae bacterium]|nr:hypothetical protein [Phycisphaerae bacterium]
MERGPLLKILTEMKGTLKELDLIIVGTSEPIEIRNVVDVDDMRGGGVIKVTTRQNHIWIEASHVAIAYQVRTDGH